MIYNKSFIKLFSIFLLTFLISCVPYSVESRRDYADKLAKKNSLKKEIIKTTNFYLLTYFKITDSNSALHVYVEGDGFAWKNRYLVSENPTPKNPLALRLATNDKNPNVLYIARPCQYVDFKIDKMCEEKFWTNARFAKSVIDSTNEVITKFEKDNKIKKVNLFGYSGGGGVVVLVASQRNDVASITTLGGNLNHKKLMELQEVSPLDESMDAIDVIEKVKNIPQFHLIGAKDETVLPEIVIDFVKKVNLAGGNAKFKIIDNANHQYESIKSL